MLPINFERKSKTAYHSWLLFSIYCKTHTEIIFEKRAAITSTYIPTAFCEPETNRTFFLGAGVFTLHGFFTCFAFFFFFFLAFAFFSHESADHYFGLVSRRVKALESYTCILKISYFLENNRNINKKVCRRIDVYISWIPGFKLN